MALVCPLLLWLKKQILQTYISPHLLIPPWDELEATSLDTDPVEVRERERDSQTQIFSTTLFYSVCSSLRITSLSLSLSLPGYLSLLSCL
mmetsp:Transcript_10161/g.10241  ORF Transcript_10161/g.10241 Transcript_10161/m.10241 type:complete len:90 (-) Transcript_10161:527-796(-)